jgi:hypothetical protein
VGEYIEQWSVQEDGTSDLNSKDALQYRVIDIKSNNLALTG